mmetsp:Transcript_3689/g.9366  ORF Transcript_3689/g.9366 Transcript_3689/m.9366 type:complete len:99 (-) Transcript_3689:327-623(-)
MMEAPSSIDVPSAIVMDETRDPCRSIPSSDEGPPVSAPHPPSRLERYAAAAAYLARCCDVSVPPIVAQAINNQLQIWRQKHKRKNNWREPARPFSHSK